MAAYGGSGMVSTTRTPAGATFASGRAPEPGLRTSRFGGPSLTGAYVWSGLEQDLLDACTRRILAAERRRGRATDENRRRTRRSTGPVELVSLDTPQLWALPGFDPYKVRKNRKSIAYSIRHKLQSRTYEPFPPQRIEIPKASGGHRVVNVFPIADEVISLRLFKFLLKKNRSRLSARSFAYRSDITAQDAIRHLRREWGRATRLFVAEYDLTDFFDRISHDHIWQSMDSLDFSMTDLERFLVNAFMTSQVSPPAASGEPPLKRRIGVPQGTSISLLLANVATGPLDRKLETMNLDFARYADDLLIWSKNYDAISEGASEVWKWSEQVQVPINHSKSEGIRLVVPKAAHKAEMLHTPAVSFLSHSIELRSVCVSERTINDIKHRTLRLLYDNLIREPRRGTQDMSRLTGNDRDYATFIWQLRRYLYGSHSEKELRRLEAGPIPRTYFTGAISHFPYTTDDTVLHDLDEWIVTQTWLALQRRESLLRGITALKPVPWGMCREALRHCRTVSSTSGQSIDLRIPSTIRMVKTIRKAVSVHGVSAIDRSNGLY